MKWIKFSKYTGDDFGIDAAGSDAGAGRLLPAKRLQQPIHAVLGMELSNNLEDLKRAIQEALESGELFPDDQMQQMLEKLASHVAGADGPVAGEPGAEAR